MNGLFITFEGLEGAGKSTQIKLLKEHLGSKGIPVISTREPGGTFIGDELRDILLDIDNKDIEPRVEALLYAASRSQLVAQVIKPALAENKIVLSDRYIDSSLAYQGYGRKLPLDVIMEFNKWATDSLTPGLTFLLHLSAEVGLERTRHRQPLPGGHQADRIESEDISFHKRVEAGYDDLARQDKDRYCVIDATQDVESLSEEIKKEVDKILTKS